MSALKERIIDISYKEKLSHLGSNLTAVDGIEAVYRVRKPDERFVLSNGHAGLALYVVLEKYRVGRFSSPLNAEKMLHAHGVHPNRDVSHAIDVSTGSLGQGLPIALGFALARRDRNTYCMISDGECSEGSIWEALRVGSEQNTTNLKVICNFNGYGAYKQTDSEELIKRFESFGWQVNCVDGHNQEEIIESLNVSAPTPVITFAFTDVTQSGFEGLHAHYKTLTETDYAKLVEEPITK